MTKHSTPYTVLAIFEAKPGKEQVLKEVLHSLIALTLQEEGCLNYDLHECPENPAKFMFYENWVTQQSHAKHCETPHIKAWRARQSELLAKPYEVTFWGMVK